MIYKIFKRLIDIFVVLLFLPLLIIITMPVSILIKCDDGGPIIYKSKRIGKNFKVFDMYKFRTMKVNSPNVINEDGSTYNSKNDDRVTRIGKKLRESSIDELPQFVNVLIGNMSLIGPRPGDVESIDTYKEDEIDKMKVKPGISGYTQAYYRNSLSVREKRLKDVWYVNHMSLLLDIKIVIKTIISVLKKENIYTNEDDKSC